MKGSRRVLYGLLKDRALQLSNSGFGDGRHIFCVASQRCVKLVLYINGLVQQTCEKQNRRRPEWHSGAGTAEVPGATDPRWHCQTSAKTKPVRGSAICGRWVGPPRTRNDDRKN